jgi:sugar phosphate isomerase/epimerase
MRLGAPIFDCPSDPDSWAAAVRREGYSAAYCPVIAPGYTPKDYRVAASRADLVIAEVGVWNNPLVADEARRAEAIRTCQIKLALAEEIGAACCVNISGSRSEPWDGPDPRNLTAETFDLIVESVRTILDAVNPRHTFYTLETMPWMYPNSAASYERLLAAVDRPAFGVHFDPVNLVTSPEIYFHNGAMISDFVQRLGPHIRSVHVKDILLRPKFMVHLDETCPGLGALDYVTLLRALATLGPNLPLMLEHLSSPAEYRQAADFIRIVSRMLARDSRGAPLF